MATRPVFAISPARRLIEKGTLAASIFFLGLFGMGASLDVVINSPYNSLMDGFVFVAFEMLVPLFLIGYILLGGMAIALAFGRKRTSSFLFALFALDFLWTFFSHRLTEPGNLFWFPTQYLTGWSLGLTWDFETLYAFLTAVVLYALSRLLCSGTVSDAVASTLSLASVTLMTFTTALVISYPGWFNAHVANYSEDVFGLNLSFVTNGLLFYASAGVAFAARLWFRHRAGRA